MAAPVCDDISRPAGQSAKPKGEAVATAINSLLKQLSDGPDFDIALVGYSTDDSGQAVVDSRWEGALAGRNFVATQDLADNPAAVEQRIRKIPDRANLTGFREESVGFPVWYRSRNQGTASQVRAFQRCAELLTEWNTSATGHRGQSVVVHICAGASGDGNPLKVIDGIRKSSIGGEPPLVFQILLSTSKLAPPTAYTGNRMALAQGAVRDVFDRSSELPAALVNALREAKTPIGKAARGLVYNARLQDVVQVLGLIKTLTRGWPSRPIPVVAPVAPTVPVDNVMETVAVETTPVNAAAETIRLDSVPVELGHADLVFELDPVDDEPLILDAGPREQAGLLVLVLDRSLGDPYAPNNESALQRLQEQANEILAQAAKKPTGQIEAAMISYGLDPTGEADVRTGFEGQLVGRACVRDNELPDGAIRVDVREEDVPNGIGGLMKIPVKKPIYFELDPTPSGGMRAGIQAVSAVVGEWLAAHPSANSRPVVVHLTRGCSDADCGPFEAALEPLTRLGDQVLLHHVVATEEPHPSVAYPTNDGALQTAPLQLLWRLSSPLLGGEELAQTRGPTISASSRGIVVNAKLDVLVPGLRSVVAS